MSIALLFGVYRGNMLFFLAVVFFSILNIVKKIMFGDKYLRITDKCSIFVDELHEMQDYNSKLL